MNEGSGKEDLYLSRTIVVLVFVVSYIVALIREYMSIMKVVFFVFAFFCTLKIRTGRFFFGGRF